MKISKTIISVFLLILIANAGFTEEMDIKYKINLQISKGIELIYAKKFNQAITIFNDQLEFLNSLPEADQNETAERIYKLLGSAYQMNNDYQNAEIAFENALQASEPFSENRIVSLKALVLINRIVGNTSKEKIYEEEITDINQIESVIDVLGVAGIFLILGDSFYSENDYFSAEMAYLEGLKLYEEESGTKANISSQEDIMKNVSIFSEIALRCANLYEIVGKSDEAEEMHNKNININKTAFGENSTEVLTQLVKILKFYRLNNHTEKSLKTAGDIKNIFKTYEKKEEIYDNVDFLINYVNLRDILGDHKLANSFFPKLINASDSGSNLSNTTMRDVYHYYAESLYHAKKYQQAKKIQNIVLTQIIKQYGADSYETENAYRTLGSIYQNLNDHQKAYSSFKKSMEININRIDRAILLMSETDKLALIINNSAISAIISEHLNHNPKNNKEAEEILNFWLKIKGVAFNSQSNYLLATQYINKLENKPKFDHYIAMRRNYAELFHSTFNNNDVKNEQLKNLQNQIDKIQTELIVKNEAPIKNIQSHQINTLTISKKLSSTNDKCIYIDYAYITSDINSTNENKRIVVAFVLDPETSHVNIVNLGSADIIDKSIGEFKFLQNERAEKGIRISHGKESKILSDLYRLLFEPLEMYTAGVKRLYVNPDGGINLLPLDVLIDSQDKYLLNRFRISYILSGNDIMKFGEHTESANTALIVYNPDFDAEYKETNDKKDQKIRSWDVSNIPTYNLDGTIKEAEEVDQILNKYNYNVTLASGKDANEQTVFNADSNKIVHIATHGFFIENNLHAMDSSSLSYYITNVADENPMLYSGLVLAGARKSIANGKAVGLMSSDKIIGINLKNTDMVVLSACETGIGSIQRGEGVFGLKRAFLMSGAKTVLSSNWKISDEVTAEFMKIFYEKMLSGKYDKAEALYMTKNEMRKRYPEPFYWASFSLTGNPG